MISLQSLITPFLDFTNLSDFFLIVLLSVLFSIAMSVLIHFLSTTISKKIFSFKNIGYIKQIFIYQAIGMVLSAAVIPLFYYVNNIINSNFYLVSMQVIVFLVVGIFVSHWIMIGTIPTFIISNILYLIYEGNDNPLLSFVYLIIFYFLSYIFALISNVFLKRSELKKSKSNKIYWLFIIWPIVSLILFSIVRFTAFFIINASMTQWSVIFVNILVNWLLFLASVAVASLIKRILDNTFTLKESIMYDNEIFVNSGYSKNAFNNHVRNNKIRTGLFITFEFKLTNDVYTENRDVLKLLIENLKNFLKKDFNTPIEKTNKKVKKNLKKIQHMFFFKTKWNEYGFFYEINANELNLIKSYENNFSIDRDRNDFFNLLEEKFKDFSSKPVIFKDKEYYFETSCFVSIYGMHSNDFEKLVEYNQKLKSHWVSKKYKNNIKVFNFKDIDDSSNKTDFKKVKENYTLDKSYININSVKAKKINSNITKPLLIPGVIWIDEQIYDFKDIYNKISSEEDLTLILRNFALRTLKLSERLISENKQKYSHHNIVINYPILELAKRSFSVKNLVKKINGFDISKSKLIFNLDFNNLESIDDLELFIKNLRDLNNELNVSYFNINKSFGDNKKIYDILSPSKIKFSPNFIFINDENEENKLIQKKFKKSPVYLIN